MKSHPLLPLLVAGLLFALSAFGQTPPRAGIRIELTTSGLAFPQPSTSPASGKAKALQNSFAATASITNRSKTGVNFTFPTAATAGARIVFTLTNSAGQELWRSTETAADAEPAEMVLKPKGTWKRTIRVPLILNDTPLAAGRYRLTATAGNDGLAKVSTNFEVLGTAPNAPASVPLSGYVMRSDSVLLPGAFPDEPKGYSFWVPRVGTIVELFDAPPGDGVMPVWTGVTDDRGRFDGPVPPETAYIRITHLTGPWVDDWPRSRVVPLNAMNGINNYPILQIPTFDLLRMDSVKEVRIVPDAEHADQIMIEADLVGSPQGPVELRPKEITLSGVLALDALESPLDPGVTRVTMPITLRFLVPKIAGVYKVQVRTKNNTREATVGPPEE